MDMVTKFPAIQLSTVIEVFAPLFALVHNWNDGDRFDQVLIAKKEFIKDTLLNEVVSGRMQGAVANKKIYDLDGTPIVDNKNNYLTELDDAATWFDMKEATSFLSNILHQQRTPFLCSLANGTEASGQASSDEGVGADDRIGEDIIQSVEAMPLPILKKKVKELSNEKVKWDRSLEVATKIGLLFYEKGLTKHATEKAFIAEYSKEFGGIPKKTVSMIYKSLPNQYRNLGERPLEVVENVGLLDEETVDTILEASVVAGFITKKEGVRNIADLKDRLEGEDVVVPSDDYMKRITGSCKRVALRHKEQK